MADSRDIMFFLFIDTTAKKTPPEEHTYFRYILYTNTGF